MEFGSRGDAHSQEPTGQITAPDGREDFTAKRWTWNPRGQGGGMKHPFPWINLVGFIVQASFVLFHIAMIIAWCVENYDYIVRKP